MNAKNDSLSREERLAAKLRENLRRRKAQSREIGTSPHESGGETLSNRGEGG